MIEKLKNQREALWKQLDALLKDKEKAFGGKERKYRKQIEQIQDELFYLEMAPRVNGIRDPQKKQDVETQLAHIKRKYPDKKWG